MSSFRNNKIYICTARLLSKPFPEELSRRSLLLKIFKKKTSKLDQYTYTHLVTDISTITKRLMYYINIQTTTALLRNESEGKNGVEWDSGHRPTWDVRAVSTRRCFALCPLYKLCYTLVTRSTLLCELDFITYRVVFLGLFGKSVLFFLWVKIIGLFYFLGFPYGTIL